MQIANMTPKALPKSGWHLREWRLSRGLSQEQLAERIGTSKGYVSDLERGERRYNQDLVEGLAGALDISVAQLLGQSPTENKAERLVPVVGYVGADTEGSVLFANGQGTGELAPIPPGGTEAASALGVRGHSMKGFADDGALIYFEEQHSKPTRDMLGHVVVVETRDGKVLVKRLLKGSHPGVYDLESIVGPTLEDVEIRWAALVTAIVPPAQARKVIVRDGDNQAA
jgi:transcriptional regulator with XRE-family HTH domain